MRRAAGIAGVASAESAPASRLKVEVWGARSLASGELDRAVTMANATVKHKVGILVGVSAEPGTPPKDTEFVAIHNPPVEVHGRSAPVVDAKGGRSRPPLTNGPADAEFYGSGTIELGATSGLWLRATTELHEDWWTREPNSWATLGVRIKDVRLSWA